MTKPQAPNSPATPGSSVRSLRRKKEVFYNVIWPALETEGWTKIDASESMNGKPIFVPKVMELKVGQKGEDFYDDEEAVLTRLLERRNQVESTIIDKFLAKVGTPTRSPARSDTQKGPHQNLQRPEHPLEDADPKEAELQGTSKTEKEATTSPTKTETPSEPAPDVKPDVAGADLDKARRNQAVMEQHKNNEGGDEPGEIKTGSMWGFVQRGTTSGTSCGSSSTKNNLGLSRTNADGTEADEENSKQSQLEEADLDNNMVDNDQDTGEEAGESGNIEDPADANGAKIETALEEKGPDQDGGNEEDQSIEKELEEAKPVKRKRGRPKRSASKNKPKGNGQAMDIDDRVPKEKLSHNGSDKDGSDYHSSDDSQPERKRKRGRPRRNPNEAPAKRAATPPRGRKPKQPPPPMLDLSWKSNRSNFPRKVSQVGPEYNVTSIEPAGSWKDGESKIYCDQIWDPEVAEEKLKGESMDFLAEQSVPHNKREAAMVGLAEVGYDVAKFDEEKILDNITTKDGSEWSEEERKMYHTEIFRLRKNILGVSKSMGKSMNSCFAYYLGTFKKSDDYRLLKSVCYQERLRRMMEAEHDLDACAICGDGGNLLICDGCEGEYHMECLRPALKIVPEGAWECDECVDRAFVAAKDSLIRNSSLFERLPSEQKAGGGSDENSAKDAKGDGAGSLRVKPTAPVMDIFTRFAQNISSAFMEGGLNGA